MIVYSVILLHVGTKQIFDQIHILINWGLLKLLIRVFKKSFLLKARPSFGIDACFVHRCCSVVYHFLNLSLIYANLIDLCRILNFQELAFYDFMHYFWSCVLKVALVGF